MEMIADLSQTLRRILTHRGPEPLRSAQIVFDRPADPFNPQQTTVDLFLFDIREDLELRSNEPVIERKNGQIITHRPPLRLACSYLVTAWPGGLTGDEAVLLEQTLLSQTLQVLAAQPTIDPVLLQGSLRGQQPPLPVVATLVDPHKNLSDFWTALGSKLRPSLTVRITVALDLMEPLVANIVTTSELELEPLMSYGIGGRVTDHRNVPVAGAVVMLPKLGVRTSTNDKGRYELSVKASGTYTLSVQKDDKERNDTVTIVEDARTEKDLQLPP
ncbi:MAG TPA: Pvc16 family protein [Terrimicrobiaceae bacterium]